MEYDPNWQANNNSREYLNNLIKRDKPKKPINIYSQDNFLCGACRECRSEIVQWRHNFCPACGQRIDWS